MTFPRDQLYCVLDYETYSEAPLKLVGAYEYSVHPSTEIICVAWRIGTREMLRRAPTRSWTPTNDLHYCELLQAMQNPEMIMVAHNAYFEQVITRNVFTRRHVYKAIQSKVIAALPPSRWLCTASLACALALPRKLEHAAAALRLPVQKDMEGHRLMMKYSKPRKATKHNAAIRHTDSADLARVVQYCETDIAAEVELFLKTRPLSALERKVWKLDQKINLRGFQVDQPLIKTVLAMIADETENLNRRCHDLTGGKIRSATQREKVLTWINTNCGALELPNLQKKTVEDALEVVKGPAREMLWLRLATSKTSTAKYEAFRLRSGHDGRVRDNFLYHAASTGRWGGAGVQPQNLPRSNLKQESIEHVIRILRGEN